MRFNGVVAFAVELGTGNGENFHLLVRYGDALRVVGIVEFAPDRQTCFGRGVADQVDDDAIADERLTLRRLPYPAPPASSC